MEGIEIFNRDFCDFIKNCKEKHLTSLCKTITEFKKVNPNREATYAYSDDEETRIECSYDESIVRHLISIDYIQYGFLSMVDSQYYWFGDYEDMQYEQKEMHKEWEDLEEQAEL
tara:strand:+ start:439 stop:780 length:342 start_codon:yes stop_codon:yes gene_type:complete